MNVALIVFRRPDLTERVLAAIAQARPDRLFLIADGPRPDHPEDIPSCAAARAAAEKIDWRCEIHRNYSDLNLGCGHRPATGISWVFEHVESAVILEDDCIPDPSFFRFCEELLDRYATDERVMQISGNSLQYGHWDAGSSYLFSRYNVCAGGFATWRRAWRHFDMRMPDWTSLRDTGWLRYATGDERAEACLRPLFDRALAAGGAANFWDFQWIFACLVESGLSIVPQVGLLSNVGFRPDGTHTRRPTPWANLPTRSIPFPLVHPRHVIPDAGADRRFVDNVLAQRPPTPWRSRVRGWLGSAKRAAAAIAPTIGAAW